MAPLKTHFLPSSDVRNSFKALSNNDENIRIEAAKGLISQIKDTSANKEQTIDYCLTRLMKGLASGNDSSRLGFSLALVELLYNLLDSKNPLSTELHFRSIIQSLIENTEPSAGLTKQEERGYYFGRLFGLKALVETGLLFDSKTDVSKWQSVLSQLLILAQKKPWLRESCCLVIRNAINSIESDQTDLLQITYNELRKSGIAKTSDGIAIHIALLAKHKDRSDSPMLPLKNWSSPFNQTYLPTLAKILMESDIKDEVSENPKQKGSWNARLPFVWDAIFNLYLENEREVLDKLDVVPFNQFWHIVVNEGFFADGASDERKFLGFLLFSKALTSFNDKEPISALFSANFMKCFINQLADTERYLHKAAQKSLRAIKAKGEAKPELANLLLSSLLSTHGTSNFEAVTRTKIVEPLAICADKGGHLLEIISLFRNIISHPEIELDVKSLERTRQWAADQLLMIVRSSKVIRQEEWVSEILELLVEYGYFKVLDRTEDAQFSGATQTMFRSRLSSCLSELLGRKEFDKICWPGKAVLLLKKKQEKGNFKLAIEIDSNLSEQVQGAMETISKLNKKTRSSPNAKAIAFETMYSLLLLQLLNGESDAVDMLDDLHMCYEKTGIKGTDKITSKSKDKHRHKRLKHEHSDSDEEDASAGLEILVELLLGFLAKSSVLAKKMSQTVFRSFVDDLPTSAVESLLRPLSVDENQEGQRELFDFDNSDFDEDEEASDNENSSDVDIMDEDEDEDEDQAEEDEEESNSDSNSSSDEEDGEEDVSSDTVMDEETEKLHAALAEALGPASALDGNNMPEGTASDSDESMDDDQMMLVDEQLSKIFKQRKTSNKKQQRQEAKESVVNFKNRVLELLLIYVKSNGQFDDKILVILPCLEVIRRTGNQAVRNNTQNVLRALTLSNKPKTTKPKSNGNPSEETDKFTSSRSDEAYKILKLIHEEVARGGQSKEHATSCSQCSLYISKCLVNTDRTWIDKIIKLYFSRTMSDWLSKGNSATQPSFFTDFVNWTATVRKQFSLDINVNLENGKTKSSKKRKEPKRNEGKGV